MNSSFLLGAIFGACLGFVIASLFKVGEVFKPCHKCNGVGGFETGRNDWHDCDVCDATGEAPPK